MDFCETGDVRSLNPFDMHGDIFYIYFLLRGKEVVYVGKTCDIKRRLRSHQKGKNKKYFNDVKYFVFSGDRDSLEYRKLEMDFICKYTPAYNIRSTPIHVIIVDSYRGDMELETL